MVWQAPVSWDAVAGTDRQLVSQLGLRLDVLWVDPPRSAVHAVRAFPDSRWRPTLENVAPGVTRLIVTTSPYPERALLAGLTRYVMERATRRAVKAAGRPVDAVVGTSPPAGLAFLDLARRVYYATDDFAAGADLMGLNASRSTRLERARLEEADAVGAVSAEIIDRWALGGRRAFVLPNGCDPDRYAEVDAAELPQDVELRGPIAGLIGQLSPRIDIGLLEEVVARGTSLLLVGPRVGHWEGVRFDELVDHPRVAWVGQKGLSELPSYLRVIDVGLTPYVDSAFNRASFPLKTLEYLAAGRPVVSTPLPAVASLATDLIRVATTPSEFADSVASLAAVRRLPPEVEERRAFARRHSWSSRADQFLSAIGLGEVPNAHNVS